MLEKIIETEKKHEPIEYGTNIEDFHKEDQIEQINTDDQSQYNRLLPKKRPCPLIKTMYIRDTKRVLFKIQKFNQNQLKNDPEVRDRALKGIKYDGFLNRKPEFDQYINKMYQKYLKKIEKYEKEVMDNETALKSDHKRACL